MFIFILFFDIWPTLFHVRFFFYILYSAQDPDRSLTFYHDIKWSVILTAIHTNATKFTEETIKI